MPIRIVAAHVGRSVRGPGAPPGSARPLGDGRAYRTTTFFVCAVNPFTVGFAHGAGSPASAAQSGGADRAAATARAWNVFAFDAFGAV